MDTSETPVKQEEEGNASDDEQQMVICEDPPPDSESKVKDKPADGDNDGQSKEGDEKNFGGRFSPVSGGKRDAQGAKVEVTCRPKPIKGKKVGNNSKKRGNLNISLWRQKFYPALLQRVELSVVLKFP